MQYNTEESSYHIVLLITSAKAEEVGGILLRVLDGQE